MSGNPGPILVYDRTERSFRLPENEDIGKNLSRLLNILREYKPELASELLRSLSPFPRYLSCIQHQYLFENFDPPVFIGAGGFGTVYKTRHKIDGNTYAIKKISGSCSSDALELARSEVLTMSRLKHVNVVNYVTSWLDYEWVSVEDQDEMPNGDFSSVQYSKYCLTHLSNEIKWKPIKSKNGYVHDKTSFDAHLSPDKFHDEKLTSNGIPDGRRKKKRGIISKTGNQSHVTALIRKKEIIPANNISMSHPPVCIRRPVLCIQLELCQYNLADWLQHRNSLFSVSSNSIDRLNISLLPPYQTMQRAPVRWLMDQIASGVAYLHSENVIHRDLKPENVLICGPPLHSISNIPCSCTMNRFSPKYDNNQMVTDFNSYLSKIDNNHNEFYSSLYTSVKLNCYHQLVVKICDFGLARILLDNSISLRRLPSVSENHSDQVHLYNKKTPPPIEISSHIIPPCLSPSISSSSSSKTSSHCSSHDDQCSSPLRASPSSSASSSQSTDSDSLIQFKNPSGYSSNNLSENDEYRKNSLIYDNNNNNNKRRDNLKFDMESTVNSSSDNAYWENTVSQGNHLPLSTYKPSTSSLCLTANLGSSIYTAPEVQRYCTRNKSTQRAFYDFKADIYSLGVIYFEMLHPCFTKSELITYLEQFFKISESSTCHSVINQKEMNTDQYHINYPIKRGGVDYLLDSFPRSMQSTWPYESHLVARMLNFNVQYRPSATEVVEILSVNSEFSDLRGNHINTPMHSVVTSFNNTCSDTSENLMTVEDKDDKSKGINYHPPDNSLSSYQLIDYLIWRNQELEQKLYETRQRLSKYENLDER